jgi:hypothetical protein
MSEMILTRAAQVDAVGTVTFGMLVQMQPMFRSIFEDSLQIHIWEFDIIDPHGIVPAMDNKSLLIRHLKWKMYLLVTSHVPFNDLSNSHLTQHFTEDLTSKVELKFNGIIETGMLSLGLW